MRTNLKKEHYKKYLNKLTHVKNLAKRLHYENLIKCNYNPSLKHSPLLKKSLIIKIFLKILYYLPNNNRR